jgi:hypothetical protein
MAAVGCSTVVDQVTRDLKFEGSNPTAAIVGREKRVCPWFDFCNVLGRPIQLRFPGKDHMSLKKMLRKTYDQIFEKRSFTWKMRSENCNKYLFKLPLEIKNNLTKILRISYEVLGIFCERLGGQRVKEFV